MAMQGGIKYLNIIQGSYAFILGLFLGYVIEKTGSLWGSIFAHLAFNFIGTFGVSWLMGMGETVYLISVIAGGIVLTAAGFFLMGPVGLISGGSWPASEDFKEGQKCMCLSEKRLSAEEVEIKKIVESKESST